ncbi:MAG: cytochrome d ubiquinol oxidase subunit II [Candidatus Omnitrophica bacterium]|nr:cytochrome d ubiquinol oxidase subunit II [Candidatus Omnitrophota bacterium]
MDLPLIWFLIVAYLFAGFFLLEGFDYGVCMLLPFISNEDEHRRMMIATISGFWDGNEVWMITLGAVLFAAFPSWYATLFSGMYPVFVLILLGLIVRGVGLKFRDDYSGHTWRFGWDMALCAGSVLVAFLWGLIVGNILRGIPINAAFSYAGGCRDLINPFSVASGIAFVALFTLHGMVFLNIRLTGEVLQKAQKLFFPVYGVTLIIAVAFLASAGRVAGLFKSPLASLFSIAAATALLLIALWFKRNSFLAFWMSAMAIVFLSVAVFARLYPRVLVSSLDPQWSLTIYNASASSYSLKVMSVVAIIFIPGVLFYQGWSYWVLRKRIEKSDLEY